MISPIYRPRSSTTHVRGNPDWAVSYEDGPIDKICNRLVTVFGLHLETDALQLGLDVGNLPDKACNKESLSRDQIEKCVVH